MHMFSGTHCFKFSSPGFYFLTLPQKKVVNLGDPGWWQNGRPGCGAWGGGDGTVIYCAGVALYMIEVGTIEECFLHEGAHVNHDSNLYHTEEWKCARDSDKHYISNYAKDHPLR